MTNLANAVMRLEHTSPKFFKEAEVTDPSAALPRLPIFSVDLVILPRDIPKDHGILPIFYFTIFLISHFEILFYNPA